MRNLKVKKVNEILARLDSNPENVSKNECLVAMSVIFNVPESTLRTRYKKMILSTT